MNQLGPARGRGAHLLHPRTRDRACSPRSTSCARRDPRFPRWLSVVGGATVLAFGAFLVDPRPARESGLAPSRRSRRDLAADDLRVAADRGHPRLGVPRRADLVAGDADEGEAARGHRRPAARRRPSARRRSGGSSRPSSPCRSDPRRSRHRRPRPRRRRAPGVGATSDGRDRGERRRRRRWTSVSTSGAASSCPTRSSSRRGRSATASSTATSSTSTGSAASAARARRSGRGSATRRRASPRRPAACSTRSASRTRASTRSSRSTRATWTTWKTPVIVNVAGESVEDYVEVARRLDGVPGVAGIELNISCPNVGAGGLQFAIDAGAAGEVTAAVRRATDLPLLVKLSPNVADIRPIARAIADAGRRRAHRHQHAVRDRRGAGPRPGRSSATSTAGCRGRRSSRSRCASSTRPSRR